VRRAGRARSFTAIAEWAADADEQTLRMLGARFAVPSESTIRRTLQRLDANALDDLAGAWVQQATMPGPANVGSSQLTARRYAAQPAAPDLAITCWPRSIMLMVPSWPRWKSVKRNQPGLLAQLASLPWRPDRPLRTIMNC
jgi:DDE_Tnp_1-associated